METEIRNITVDNTYWPSGTGDWWNPNKPYKISETPTYTYWSTLPQTIYMYQLQCPDCKTMNWGQLDTIVKCKGSKCKSTLRAVSASPKVDHNIEVE